MTHETVTAEAGNATAIGILKQRFGERVSVNPGVREQHGRGEGYLPSQPPDAVLFVETTEEVAEAVGLCARYRVPIIPFGVGTSLEGHVGAPRGGLSIDLSAMSRVLEVNDDDLDVLVEAGVTRKQLNTALRDKGLFFPIDPGADATIGGMAATRASGTNAVRYGTMRENVLGLTVVLADGRVIRTGGRARKSAAGYDLTRLFVGSEGTLGVITQIRLRLHGIPEAMAAAVCAFPTVADAVQTVIQTIQLGVPVARIELLDELQMQACTSYAKLDRYRAAPTLFIEFHGSKAGVEEQAAAVAALAVEHGGDDFQWTTLAEERNRLWQARHDAYYAALQLRPGAKGWATDVCVPISALADCIEATRTDVAERGLLAPIVGHVGDGNFHLLLLIDPDDSQERRKAEEVNKRLVLRAIAMGGTCTGEHGIGQGKISSLETEHGEAVTVMRAIKTALDPMDIMNPGKIFRPGAT